jgi:hypothetical protein
MNKTSKVMPEPPKAQPADGPTLPTGLVKAAEPSKVPITAAVLITGTVLTTAAVSCVIIVASVLLVHYCEL